MLDWAQRTTDRHLRTALSVSIVALGIGLCLYSLHLLPGWHESVSGMSLRQQLAAFTQSEFPASLVLTILWLGRILALWKLTRRHDQFARYRALRRWRRLAACIISSLLAAAASFWALLLTFDLHPIAAIFPAVILFGSAMYWLESWVAFGKEAGPVTDRP